MTDYRFPEINPRGPIPAPNTQSRDARPALRAGRELSAYCDNDYPESCLQAERRAAHEGLSATDRTGNAAYGNMRDPEPSDSTSFEAFDPNS